ncbi:hypothetical protein JCM10296v2_003016 [Rhodotorula toruloides]
MFDSTRPMKDPQGARTDSVPLEEMGGRGRRRDRPERDRARRSVTAGGFLCARGRLRTRRSDADETIDFLVEGEDEVEAALGEEVGFEVFRQATSTPNQSTLGPSTRQTDSLARRRPHPFSPASLPPTIDILSPPISPSFGLSPSCTPSNLNSANEEDDTPSYFWSPEYQTARHIARFGAGGHPSLASSSLASTTRNSWNLSRRARRISYDVPEECEAWTLAQGIVDETSVAPRLAWQTLIGEKHYRQSDAWKEEGSDLFARRKEAAAKRLEMVAQQLAWM